MKSLGPRFITGLVILFLIFVGTRSLVRFLPGDPVQTLLADSGTALNEVAIREDLGLDKSFFPALIHDLKQAAHGDLGISLTTREPIAPLLGFRFLHTLELTIASLMLSLLICIPLGVAAAGRPGGKADRFCDGFGALSSSLPIPWIGPALIIVFSIWIHLFPIEKNIALPAVTLAITYSGIWARLIRLRVRETLEVGAAVGARARGISEWKIGLKYGLAPSSSALVAYFGTQVGVLLGGSFVTEVIFNWPGLGSLLVDAVLKRDYPIVEYGSFIAAVTCYLGTSSGDYLAHLIQGKRGIA